MWKRTAIFMGMIAVMALAGMMWVIAAGTMADAGVGGLAGDGCHKHKDSTERHYPGTKVPDGECFEVDGVTYKVPYAIIKELQNGRAAQCADSVDTFYGRWSDQYASWKTTAHAGRTAIRCLTNE